MIKLSLNVNHNTLTTRQDVRNYVIKEFLKEKPGTGNQKSAYRYDVETLSNGDKIFLERPAHLNKGMDFVIKVDNNIFPHASYYKKRQKWIWGNIEVPSYISIFVDLYYKKIDNFQTYQNLFLEIENIYNVKIYSTSLNFKYGYPCDMLLGIIKWMFIEQDITYWNYSGREMLMKEILKYK
ncbi:MAG: hypothetical protein VB017_00550 [Endomicrobiaceae bacterium]|nr:hypothetical protein [Endomicrobiaceae bacterium]